MTATQYKVCYHDNEELMSSIESLIDCGHGHHFSVEVDQNALIVHDSGMRCLQGES